MFTLLFNSRLTDCVNLVVDEGYDPSRSSPSDQSPEFISLRRAPAPSTILSNTRILASFCWIVKPIQKKDAK